MIRTLRIFVLSAFAIAMASCSSGAGLLGGLGGGSNGGGIFPGTSCNPGTDVQLANPLPFQTGVNPNIGQITIVANGNNNYLGQNYQTMNITLVDSFGNQMSGGAFQPVSFTQGPHPYNSDFYYASSIGPLQTGMTYTAEITIVNFNSFNSCSYALEQFRT